MMVVLSGSVRISVSSPDGKELTHVRSRNLLGYPQPFAAYPQPFAAPALQIAEISFARIALQE